MEDWKKSEGIFSLACDPQRASGMMQNTCVKIEHVTKHFGEDIVLQEVNLSLKTGNVYGIVGNNGSGSHNEEDIRILCDHVYEMDGGILRERTA